MAAFEIDASELQRLASQSAEAPKIVRSELLTGMRGVGLDVERYAKIAAPVYRGELRRGIGSKVQAVSGGVQAIVGVASSVKHARPVEEGRRPGATPPPVAAITPWANKHGINPYVLARSIGRRGIKARPYLKPAAVRAVAESGRHMRPMIARIEARLFR